MAVCPTPPDASNYEVSICMQKESRGKIDFDGVWSPENGGNVPSPTPTHTHQTVSDAINGASQVVLILGSGFLLLILLYVLLLAFQGKKGSHHSE